MFYGSPDTYCKCLDDLAKTWHFILSFYFSLELLSQISLILLCALVCHNSLFPQSVTSNCSHKRENYISQDFFPNLCQIYLVAFCVTPLPNKHRHTCTQCATRSSWEFRSVTVSHLLLFQTWVQCKPGMTDTQYASIGLLTWPELHSNVPITDEPYSRSWFAATFSLVKFLGLMIGQHILSGVNRKKECLEWECWTLLEAFFFCLAE